MAKARSATQLRTRDRILRAALEWAEETGMRKLSMDEIASRARLGRATLYIHFPGRDALIAAAVRLELERFFEAQRAVGLKYGNPEERLVHMFGSAYRALRNHRILSAIKRLNPQILAPYVLGGNDVAIDMGREFILATLGAEIRDRRAATELAELIVRSYHSFILAPSTVFDLDADDGPEDYARRYLLPLLHRAIHATESCDS